MISKTDESQNISFIEFLSIQRWLFKIFYKEAPILTLTRTIFVAISELQRLVSVLILGYIIDKIIEVSSKSGDLNQVLLPLFCSFCFKDLLFHCNRDK